MEKITKGTMMNYEGVDDREIQQQCRMIPGPDGKLYPQYIIQKISGLRPTSQQEEGEVEAPPDSLAETNSEYQEMIRPQTRHQVAVVLSEIVEENPTIPVLRNMLEEAKFYELKCKKYLASLEKIKEEDAAQPDSGRSETEGGLSDEEPYQDSDLVLERLRSRWISSSAKREIEYLESRLGPDAIPWWNSNNSVVRLWGQLHSVLQVFDDFQMLNDLVDVLGKEWLDSGVITPSQEEKIVFVYMTENIDRLKKAIREKYPDLNNIFDLIANKS